MSFEYKKHERYPDEILIRNFVGNVGADDIIDSWKYLIENKLIDKSTKGVINNLTGCDLFLDLNNFKTVLSFLKKQKKLHGLKLAVICDTPKKTVFPILGGLDQNNFEIKPFSTAEAAVSWIMFEP